LATYRLVCADALASKRRENDRDALIEHRHENRVELMMSRARAILVSLIPALLLLASADCFSTPLSPCGGDALCSLRSAGDHAQHNQPPADNSFAQVVQRWSRRLNAPPGCAGFAAPPALTVSPSVLPGLIVARIALPLPNLELAQCWQFHWRAALEPRAPSLVS
jgi:hypothetical protein